MKSLTTALMLTFSRKDSRLVIILATLLFLFLLLLVQNGKSAITVFGFEAIPFFKRTLLGLQTLFDVKSTFTGSTFILALLGSLLGGINLSLGYTYMRLRGDLILKSGLYSGVGLVFAFLGIGCAACGTAFFSVLLGFFGFSAMLNVLPFEGQEIGYTGLLILCIATYTLARKVSSPNVC